MIRLPARRHRTPRWSAIPATHRSRLSTSPSLLLTLLACTPAARATQDALVIRHVTVIPMTTTTGPLPRHTVIVSDGRITALGPDERVSVPAGAIEVDGT